ADVVEPAVNLELGPVGDLAGAASMAGRETKGGLGDTSRGSANDGGRPGNDFDDVGHSVRARLSRFAGVEASVPAGNLRHRLQRRALSVALSRTRCDVAAARRVR